MSHETENSFSSTAMTASLPSTKASLFSVANSKGLAACGACRTWPYAFLQSSLYAVGSSLCRCQIHATPMDGAASGVLVKHARLVQFLPARVDGEEHLSVSTGGAGQVACEGPRHNFSGDGTESFFERAVSPLRGERERATGWQTRDRTSDDVEASYSVWVDRAPQRSSALQPYPDCRRVRIQGTFTCSRNSFPGIN
eukprot:955125-Rhodomonas_salina.2